MSSSHDCPLLEHATTKGWATKTDSDGYGTRRRFFVVKDGLLMYFKDAPRSDHVDSVPHAAVNLQGVHVDVSTDGRQLVINHGGGHQLLCMKDFSWRHEFLMKFDEAGEAEKWAQAIKREITPLRQAFPDETLLLQLL